MTRPPKPRWVEFTPEVTSFKPQGVPLRFLEEVHLTVEELEALRLKDWEGLEGEEAAQRMQVSRPTFQRVLESARRKVAEALVGGKALRIEGGNFAVRPPRFQCGQCGHQWEVPLEELVAGLPVICPHCQSRDIMSLQPSFPGRGWGGRRGRGWRGGGPWSR